MEITEKEYAVIVEISSNTTPDQRTIANNTGISLGMTNIIIKRLINKGYVKARQLNHKKIQYILTSQGFAEKARKSYRFTLKTIDLIRMMKNKVRHLIDEEHLQGADTVIIRGSGELTDMVKLSVNDLPYPLTLERQTISDSDTPSVNNLVFISSSGEYRHEIDLVEYLADSGTDQRSCA